MPDSSLHAMLQHASIPTLIMCLAQITGEDSWLAAPFLPKRDTNLFADESGGLPAAVQQTVRDAAERVLGEIERGIRKLPPPPDAARFTRMMSVCVAEDIAPKYVPMMMEEMELADRDVHWQGASPPGSAARFPVLIIGAGIAGMCAAVKLDRLGIPWTLVDKNPEPGGTWYENDYPEAGVDTPNHFYSYSFAPNYRWSGYFSKAREVLDYILMVGSRFDVLRRIRYNTEVKSLAWDESKKQWCATVADAAGLTRTLAASAVICAVGQLNRPRVPNLEGLEAYAGAWFHSAQWRHDVALAGKRVAVIGTGASAMQFMRTVAGEAAHLTIFQRSPQWVKPSPDYHRVVTPETLWLLEHVPFYYRWYRFGLLWRFGDGLLRTLRRDPSWPHPERAMNRTNDRHREFLAAYLLTELSGREDLVAKAMPHYPPYGKRMLVDNDWFRTLKRDNVELVTDGVACIDGNRIVDSAGRVHTSDVIIFATGFEAGKFLAPMDIRGRSGRPLREIWGDDDARAYLGITVPDYPNLFCLYGPNTNLAHGGSIVFQVECQMRYVSGCMVAMLERGIAAIDVRREVHDDYNARVDAEHEQLVWTHPGMNSWFRNARGRVFSPMPWAMADYWEMTHEPDLSSYITTAALSES